MLPFEIRAIVSSYFNDYAARKFLAAVSTCTPLCRYAKVGVIVPMVTGFAGFSACLMTIWRNYE